VTALSTIPNQGSFSASNRSSSNSRCRERTQTVNMQFELPVVETRETVAYFHLEGPVPSVVAEVVTRGHGFYSLFDPVYGLKVGSHMRGRPADPDEAVGPDPALVAEIAAWTKERFPAADPEPVHAESCFYTTTDDERFILERHGRIVVGSACSGHGFKFAPAVGKQLAALAAEAL